MEKKRLISILLGLLLFISIWIIFLLYANDILYTEDTKTKDIVTFLFMSFSLPLVYSLLYQKKYPTQTVLALGIAETILYRLTSFDADTYLLQYFFYQINVLLGSVVVLLGGFVDIVVTGMFNPIKNYFNDKRLPSPSIPVLLGITCFIIGYFLISTELYKFLLVNQPL